MRKVAVAIGAVCLVFGLMGAASPAVGQPKRFDLGLGRYDHGIVGDLSLVKLQAALTGRWVDGEETATLLAPYEEWQGLACEVLLLGWARGLVPGASPDEARIARRRARRAA